MYLAHPQWQELVSCHRRQHPQNPDHLKHTTPPDAQRRRGSMLMKDGFNRDREGRIIARMDGNWLRDGTGRLIARYDQWDRRTRDAHGRVVGDGDQRLRVFGEGESRKWKSDRRLRTTSLCRIDSHCPATSHPANTENRHSGGPQCHHGRFGDCNRAGINRKHGD